RRADGGLRQPRGPRPHRADGARALLEPEPRRAVAQGGDVGERDARARGEGRLRPRRAAHGRRSRRAGVPHGDADVLRRRHSDGGGGLVPVYREVPGDLSTPVSAFLALSPRSSRAFLLESVVGGDRIARYSFIGRDPAETVEARGPGDDLLGALRARMGAPAAEVPGLPRLTGGAVGYLSYDAVRLFERIP